MVQRFGSREICDVTFKALNEMTLPNGKIAKAGQPIFVIDTAQTSNMEQASTVVYAQGGRGYNRLIAWEGEKTMTFNVTDALMSPLGLSMLTNAGIADATASKPIHVHTTMDVAAGAPVYTAVTTAKAKDLGRYYEKTVVDGEDVYTLTSDSAVDGTKTYYAMSSVAKVSLEDLIAELGLPASTETVKICQDSKVQIYATVLDHNGSIIDWVDAEDIELGGTPVNNLISVTKNADAEFTVQNVASKTLKFDFYVVMNSGATQVTIKPNDFGGYFYVEADTLYRNEDGKDMAATLTFPKVKINSAFTITMAANGDPSTFDFQMDAMPAYTYFDKTKKVVCDIAIVGGSEGESNIFHTDPVAHTSGE